MTDVKEIDSPATEETAVPRRSRRTRAEGGGVTTPTRRRPRLRGTELIESLRESVEQLLRENRSLKRQLKAATAGVASAAPGAEKALRSIQRKVARAVSGETTPRRRTRGTATNGRRRRRTQTSQVAKD